VTGNSQEYVDHLMDCLAPLANLTSGRFFGGRDIRADGVQFAMVMGDVLYFAVDDTTRPKYAAMGSGCFWYTTRKGRVDVTKYYEVPGELLEDRAVLLALAKEAIATALRARRPKRATAGR